MNFTGENKLVLTSEAMIRALEDSINSHLYGENFIRVLSIKRDYLSENFELTITTDRKAGDEAGA